MVVLGAGLALGVTMDCVMGAAGINTIATLLIAFLRPTLIGMLYGRENAREGGVPSSARFGERIFVGYLVALTLIHHAVFARGTFMDPCAAYVAAHRRQFGGVGGLHLDHRPYLHG